jgi:hypothetical protein
MPRPLLSLLSCFAVITGLFAAEKSAPPPIKIEPLDSPSEASVTAPTLARAPDGSVWLAWIESAPGGATVRSASLNPITLRWSAAQRVATGPRILDVDTAPPALAVGQGGRVTVAWTETSAAAPATESILLSSSTDAGLTWTAPSPLTTESKTNSLPVLTTLADGRVLAAWLDRRGRTSGDFDVRLYARIVGEPAGPDVLIEARVSEKSPPALVSFPDGSALLSYRTLGEGLIRDIKVVRYRAGRWENNHNLNRDEWRSPPCPASGPQLAVSGGRVAAAWFTAAEDRPRLRISSSPDAGSRFLLPLNVDFGHPLGGPAVAMLHDGALVALWVEGESSRPNGPPSGVWLRRATPDYSLDPPVLILAESPAKIRGQPRLAIVRDFAGGNSDAVLLAAFPAIGVGGGLRAYLITIPEGALLAAAAECGCALSPDQVMGIPIRGTIVSVDPAHGEVVVKHAEVPGLRVGGAHTYRAAPELIARVEPGRDFLARIKPPGESWTISDLRLLVIPPEEKK